jgi:formylglycine-generating enzyme required for sulfatase activity
MAHDVFISYSSNDQKIVEGLSAYLEQNSIRCFVAYRDIPKAVVWQEAITEAIENCKLMLVVFSEHFNRSKEVDREITLCIEDSKPILTFKIQNAAFVGTKKYYLQNLNWIDAFPNPEEYFGKLCDDVLKLMPKICLQKDKVLTSPSIEDTFENNMIFVKGGIFIMGCSDETDTQCDPDEKPAHQKKVHDFYLSKYQVTQKQWIEIMRSNPSIFKDNENCPVENVSWFDIQQFIKKINKYTGKNYRLPSEIEWEYAARGGINEHKHRFSGSDDINEVAWYRGNSENKTHPVGEKWPNELGIYDMSGNVQEWCKDKYKNYNLSQENGFALNYFVLRGGNWKSTAKRCRVSARNSGDPYNFKGGFRLAHDVNL